MADPAPSDKTPAEKDLVAAFNDKANKKFRKLWRVEAELVDDFEMSLDWYQNWSSKRDGYKAGNDAQREKFCQEMVEFWDRHLVKTTARLANFKEKVEASKDPVAAEFVQKKFTSLQPIYDALAPLDDTAIKNGKAIFDALMPLAEKTPEPPKVQPQSPLDKGNPFKKGPPTV